MNGALSSKEERRAAIMHYRRARKGGMSLEERLQCCSIGGVYRMTGPNKAGNSEETEIQCCTEESLCWSSPLPITTQIKCAEVKRLVMSTGGRPSSPLALGGIKKKKKSLDFTYFLRNNFVFVARADKEARTARHFPRSRFFFFFPVGLEIFLCGAALLGRTVRLCF